MMENIAPAVLNGGFSTLLALSLLITSKSHVAMSFFKIFFMICIFGLFHGLILLPTVLCMIGPSDEDILRTNSKKKTVENGQGLIKKSAKSDQYEKENEKNMQTENAEAQVPLNQEETDLGAETITASANEIVFKDATLPHYNMEDKQKEVAVDTPETMDVSSDSIESNNDSSRMTTMQSNGGDLITTAINDFNGHPEAGNTKQNIQHQM